MIEKVNVSEHTDWDGVFTGLATADVLVDAVRDLQLRLLALEGKSEEADRLQAVRAGREEVQWSSPSTRPQRGWGFWHWIIVTGVAVTFGLIISTLF